MPIHFACPACNAAFTVNDRMAGRRLTCTSCGQGATVPGGVQEVREQEVRESREVAPRAVVRREPVELPDEVRAELRPQRRPVRRQPEWDDRQPVRPRGYRCPFCQSRAYPLYKSKISTGGWITFFALLLFLCIPLCWIGLLMTDTTRVCPDCGMNLG